MREKGWPQEIYLALDSMAIKSKLPGKFVRRKDHRHGVPEFPRR
jgi:hypothetical protein